MATAIEHVQVAHHLVLRANHRNEFDAAALVRSWPIVTSAALAAHGRVMAADRDPDLIVQRAALDAEAMRRDGSAHIWPGPGKQDPALTQVSSALLAAADASAAAMTFDESPQANRLITSILWTTSQLVSRASSDLLFDLRHVGREYGESREATMPLALDAYRRINAVEQMAAAALARPQPPTDAPAAGVALRRAVAAWDVESHRALLGEQSTAVLHVLSHLEAESIKGVESFVARAPKAGLIDLVSAGRLLPILRDSSASWEKLRDASEQLSFAGTAVPMPFIGAARSLQDNFAKATHSDLSLHGRDLVQALSSHLESSVTIAASATALIANGELRAPARAVARLMAADSPDKASPMAAPVDAAAIHRGMTVPLPPEIRDLLAAPARNVLENAHEAVRRAAGLDSAFRTSASPGTSAVETAHVTPSGPSATVTEPHRSRASSPTF
jgi:hypothetical protein